MIVSGILKEDLILPDGTRVPKEEFDWSHPISIKYSEDDNQKQTDTEGNLCEHVRDILDEESKLD